MSVLTGCKTYGRKNIKKRRAPFPKDLVKQCSKSENSTTLFNELFLEKLKQRNLTVGKDESNKENALPKKNKQKQQRKFVRKKDQLPSSGLYDLLESCDAEADNTFDELLQGPCYRPANFKHDASNNNDTIEVDKTSNEFEDTLFASPKLKQKGMKHAKAGRKPHKVDTAAACIGTVPKSREPNTIHDVTVPKSREPVTVHAAIAPNSREHDTVYAAIAPKFQEPVALHTSNVSKCQELCTVHTNTALDTLQADSTVPNNLLNEIGTTPKTHQANTLASSQQPTTDVIDNLSLCLNQVGISPFKAQLMGSSTPIKFKFEFNRFPDTLDISPISHGNNISTKIVYNSPEQHPRLVEGTYVCDVRHNEVQKVEERLFKKPICLSSESNIMSCKNKSPLHIHNDKPICNEGNDNKSIHVTSVQPIHIKETLKCSATRDAVSVENINLCTPLKDEAGYSEPDTIVRKYMPAKLGVVVRRHLLDFDSSLDMFSSCEEENNLSTPEDANTVRTDHISGDNECDITELKINSPISKRSFNSFGTIHQISISSEEIINSFRTTHEISTSSDEISVVPTEYNCVNSELDDSDLPIIVLKNNMKAIQTVSVHLSSPVLTSTGNLSEKCSQDTQNNTSYLENSHANDITSPVSSLLSTFYVHCAQVNSFESKVQNSDCAIIIPRNKLGSDESTNDILQTIVKDPSHLTLLTPKNAINCSLMKLGTKLYSSEGDSEGQLTVVHISPFSTFTSLHDNRPLIKIANKLEYGESVNETLTITEDCTYSVVVSPRVERDTSKIVGDNNSFIENNLRRESASVIIESDLTQIGASYEPCNSDKAADNQVFHTTTTLQGGNLCCRDNSVQDVLQTSSEKPQCHKQERGSCFGCCRSSRQASSMLSNSRVHSRHSQHNVIVLPEPVRPSLGFQNVFSKNGTVPSIPEVSSILSYSSSSVVEPETESLWTARDEVLLRCDQIQPIPFSQAMPDNYFKNCKKIGEGVYGEVFSCIKPNGDKTVLKIIPIEGSDLVNGEIQKSFESILSEIVIAMELSNLRKGTYFCTDGFAKLERCWCLQGMYPPRLLELWNEFNINKGSENNDPIMFLDDQLYIVLELAHGGIDLEAYVFNSAEQSLSVFQQVAYTLAVAECALEFEHRDLHWGNILIAPTSDRNKTFVLFGEQYSVPTKGVQVAVIDFTLSRMTFDGCCIFNDLSQDPTLFQSQGDYQFEVYRLMQKHTADQWDTYAPFTNIIWLHYVLDKMINGAHYRRKYTKVHQKFIDKLEQLKTSICESECSAEFVLAHYQ